MVVFAWARNGKKNTKAKNAVENRKLNPTAANGSVARVRLTI